MEPIYDRKNSLIFKKIFEGDKEILKQLYPQYNFNLYTKEMVTFRDLNRFPAKQGVMFQEITQFLSNSSWFLFLIFSLLLRSLSLKMSKRN